MLRSAMNITRRTLAGAAAVFVLCVATVPVIGFSLFPTADIPQFLKPPHLVGSQIDSHPLAVRIRFLLHSDAPSFI